VPLRISLFILHPSSFLLKAVTAVFHQAGFADFAEGNITLNAGDVAAGMGAETETKAADMFRAVTNFAVTTNHVKRVAAFGLSAQPSRVFVKADLVLFIFPGGSVSNRPVFFVFTQTGRAFANSLI